MGNEINVDELGRIVIPIAMRRQFGIALKGKVEFEPREDGILLKARTMSCVICRRAEGDGLVDVGGRYICPQCIQLITQRVG